MGGKSERTFRIKGLNPTLSKEQLDKTIKNLNAHEERYKDCLPRTSLAFLPVDDNVRKCSTVSCVSKRHKKGLLDRVDEYSDWPATPSTLQPLCKDTFEGMTILSSPENADLDICFVHGLNGHAIDTFEKSVPRAGPRSYRKQPFHFWPMDILEHEQLRTSRVLSFDYNSKLRDTSNTSGIKQWSLDILGSLHNVRSRCPDRPIIFVGYSLGGIVARQAATDLWTNRESEDFNKNVPLRNCGFMFLGTPHKGSLQADNSRITLLLLGTMGYRTEMLQLFNHFNHHLEYDTAMWRQLEKSDRVGVRPIVCFSEARKSKVLRGFLRRRVIVAREEAEWMNGIVEEIPDSDHHSICAYSSAHEPGLEKILSRLVWIKGQLSVQYQGGQLSTQDRRQRETSHGDDQGDSLTTSASVADATPHSVSSSPSARGSSAQDLSSSGSSQCSCALVQVVQDVSTGKRAPIRKDLDQGHVSSIVSTYCSFCHPVSWKEKSRLNSSTFINTNSNVSISNVRCLLAVSVQSDAGATSKLTPEEGENKHACAPSKTHTSGNVEGSTVPSVSDSGPDPPSPHRAEKHLSKSRLPSDISVTANGSIAAPLVDQDTAWKKQSILCIDGGGLRGYSSLLILRELMSRIGDIERQSDELRTEARPWTDRDQKWASRQRSSSSISAVSTRVVRRFNRPDTSKKHTKHVDKGEPYLPCHYFDYIFGTGTGGMIAIMLGRLRMSIKDCVEEYRWLARDFFDIPLQPLLTNRFRSHEKSQDLESRLKKLVGNHTGAERDPRFKSPVDLCKTCVMSFDVTSGRVKAFRTYDQAVERFTDSDCRPSRFEPINPGVADNCEIWKAARATSSAPSHFKPVHINDKRYLDGGIKTNNPARESINEVANMLGGDPSAISSLISIGCGLPKESKQDVRGFRMLSARNSLKAAAIDSNSVHEDVEFRASVYKIPYSRFEVDGLAWKLPLMEDQSDTIYKVFEDELATYFQRNEKASAQLDRCAKDLVDQRRLRAQNPDRWRRFTHATFFRCEYHKKEYNLRGPFRKHLKHHHSEWLEKSNSERESYIDSFKVKPIIPGGPQQDDLGVA